jgi:hypothetical protein
MRRALRARRSRFVGVALASVLLVACGDDGSTENSPTDPPPAAIPTVSLGANPSSVQSGAMSQLAWSSTNATACTASGAWSGAKATSGAQSIGPLLNTSNYTLSCTGAGGSVQRSATVTVNAGGNATLTGLVDSSLVDRHGANRVYVYTGSVTPDDYDGDAGDPVTTATVLPDINACTFAYALQSLAAGQYTIAFTNDAAADLPTQNDTLTFVGTTQATVGAQPTTQHFTRSNVLRVGPTRQFATVRAAEAAAGDGDLIEIDAGTYTDDVVVFRQNNLTLRGVGGARAHLRGSQVIPFQSGNDQRNGKGLWVTIGDDILVENIEFSGARVTDENGAGIRAEGVGLTICNSYFHDNENGILGGAYGELLIEYSEFAGNGIGADGFTHNLYIDEGAGPFIFRYNYSHHAHIGHLLKTRADVNYVLYNRIMEEVTGNSSYSIDVPNGGLTYIIGNLIQQGPNTDNSTIIAYGAEGLSNPNSRLFLVNNTIVNDLGSGTHVSVAGGTLQAVFTNNIFAGGGSVGGGAQQSNNIVTTAPGLVDIDGFDYRLTSGSPARDAGTNPGTGAGFNLTPRYQYVHPSGRTDRAQNGTIDVGAYEFTP